MGLYGKGSMSRHITVIIDVTGKKLFDWNTLYNPIVHRIHGYWYYLLFWLLFTMYTITVNCLLSLYHPCNVSNMILIVLTESNNNVNGQLILGLGKLMEETMSVFWVDLGYRLHCRLRVPLQGSMGRLTTHLFIVPQCYCEYSSTVIL